MRIPRLSAGAIALTGLASAAALPCPGCGMTRSVVALLHGDLASSLAYHPPRWLGTDAWARGPLPSVGVAAFMALWLVRLPVYLNGAWAY